MRLVGNPSPDFNMAVVSGDGQAFSRVSLEDYKGKWLVLFFYPLDFTFVCPTEITGYSKAYEQFREAGAEVLGATDMRYHCRCSRESLLEALAGFGTERLAEVFPGEAPVDVRCDYCGKEYRIAPEDVPGGRP